jgi:hypothetical protein
LSALPQSLVALLYARMPLDEGQRRHFVRRAERAVRDFEKADRNYQKAIKRTLSREHAHEMLAAMETFRRNVTGIREQARQVAAFGDFDPLDTFVPSFPGTHADAVRAANVGDQARQAVADARAHVNAHVADMLSSDQLERLLEAKRQRGAAFERAIRNAFPKETGPQLLSQLVMLADGWY